MGGKEEEFVDHECSREARNRRMSRRIDNRRKRHASTDALGRKLLVAAGLGDSERCKRILDRAESDYSSTLIANWSDGSDFSTALHAACRVGCISTVKTLVRHGSSFKNKDLRGNTPLHCAALRGNHELIIWVLDKYPKEAMVGMEEKNDDGVRAEEILESVMERETFEREKEKEMHRQYESKDREGKWMEKIMSELEWEQEEDIYYGSSWHHAEYETADEYAERIWREMQEKLYRKLPRSTKKQRMHKEKKSNDDVREGKEKYARPMLEEESWKQAVLLGDYTAKKARYEAQWEFFCSEQKYLGTLKQPQIPWIVPMEILHSSRAKEELERMLWSDVEGAGEKKKVVRKHLVRWHPDKFMSQFGKFIDPAEVDAVRQSVNMVSQLLALIYSGQH
eukprot:jgi/Picsp_1/3453/NSC_06291-R1_nuclear factor of kappa light polypeptide gene enhancer in b-cells inhibitor-like 1